MPSFDVERIGRTMRSAECGDTAAGVDIDGPPASPRHDGADAATLFPIPVAASPEMAPGIPRRTPRSWHDPCITGCGIGTTYAPDVSSFFKDRQFCERFESNAVAFRCQASPPVPRLFCGRRIGRLPREVPQDHKGMPGQGRSVRAPIVRAAT